jgi:hypothetical protein
MKWSLLVVAGLGAGVSQLALGGCSMSTRPGVALHDVGFTEPPYIVHRGDDYYLHYRAATSQGGKMALRVVVDAKQTKDKGYYYFIGPISQPERGNVVERPLASDGLAELARRKAVYWLNPDGSEILLEIKEEPAPAHD